MMAPTKTALLPGAGLDSSKMPGHWLLARLGKRVLRPGGVALSRQLLEALAIQPSDSVVEFAPGLGATRSSKPGPKGPASELVQSILELKQASKK